MKFLGKRKKERKTFKQWVRDLLLMRYERRLERHVELLEQNLGELSDYIVKLEEKLQAKQQHYNKNKNKNKKKN